VYDQSSSHTKSKTQQLLGRKLSKPKPGQLGSGETLLLEEKQGGGWESALLSKDHHLNSAFNSPISLLQHRQGARVCYRINEKMFGEIPKQGKSRSAFFFCLLTNPAPTSAQPEVD